MFMLMHIPRSLKLSTLKDKKVGAPLHTSVLHNDVALFLRWTQFCLLIAPEVATFWNVRKMFLRQGHLGVDADLHLTKLILSRKPKCMQVFQHRKWMFSNILMKDLPRQANGTHDFNEDNRNGNVDLGNSVYVKQFLFSELNICAWTADKHQNNYHSWNHRLWVLQQFGSLVGFADVCRSEYETSHSWISIHVSEHSGLHYLQYLLDSIVSFVTEAKVEIMEIVPCVDSLERLYEKELEFNRDLIEEYRDHEALFCHRRFLLTRLRDLCSSPQRTCSPPSPAMKRSCVETVNSAWSAVLLGERDLINRCLQTSSYQKTLGEKHAQWLNNVVGI
ncbi:hypothetical protein OTU49_000868 [Cherax quadricarinatus]|uniref:Uncharacterized protein n=1 Tax=Cherax quadricarinatus TaxID=27406 RepID=A0AAW0XJH6_CHEQU|nr:protein prenyltransferase alpha subunit repeat-containing protein 1-like isoform X2 [Cherax quadricarinatus]